MTSQSGSRELWLGSVVLLLLIAACGPVAPAPTPERTGVSPTAVAPGPVSPPTIAATPGLGLRWADGKAVDGTTIDISTARYLDEGSGYRPLFSSAPSVAGAPRVGGLGLLNDGTLIALQVDTNTSVVGSFDHRGFSAFEGVPTIKNDGPRFAYGAAVEGQELTWVESETSSLFYQDWRIFSRDPSGTTRLVARAEDIPHEGSLPVLDGFTTTAISDDRVYFATPVPDSAGRMAENGSRYRVDVMSRSLNGGGPLRTEAEGAGQPAVVNGVLYVIKTAYDDATVSPGHAVVERVDAPGRATAVLRLDSQPGSYLVGATATGERLAFVLANHTGRGGVIYLLEPVTRDVVRIPINQDGSTTTLAGCPGRLAWSSADQTGSGATEPFYVIDTATLDLLAIAVPAAYGGAICGGNEVAWNQLNLEREKSATFTVAEILGG